MWVICEKLAGVDGWAAPVMSRNGIFEMQARGQDSRAEHEIMGVQLSAKFFCLLVDQSIKISR